MIFGDLCIFGFSFPIIIIPFKMQSKLHTATLAIVYVEAVYTQKSTPSADNITIHTGKCLISKKAIQYMLKMSIF